MRAQRHELARDDGGDRSERPHHLAAWPIPVIGLIRNKLHQHHVDVADVVDVPVGGR